MPVRLWHHRDWNDQAGEVKLEGDAPSSVRSASSKSSIGGDFPKVRPLLWFKINERKEQTAVPQRLVPFFFGVSLLCSHTVFQNVSFSVSGIFFWSCHRRELLVNL